MNFRKKKCLNIKSSYGNVTVFGLYKYLVLMQTSIFGIFYNIQFAGKIISRAILLHLFCKTCKIKKKISLDSHPALRLQNPGIL